MLVAFLPGDQYVSTIARVGTYRVERQRDESDEIDTLTLRDRKGRAVTTIKNYRVGLLGINYPKGKSVRDLNRDGIPEVIFESWTGGAHGSQLYYLWSLGPKPVCRLAYDKGNVWGDERDFTFVDLDRDGVPEIRTWYDGFAYQYGGAYSAHLPMILKWRNGRYVDATRRFHSELEAATEDARVGFEERLKEGSVVSGRAAARLVALSELTGRREETFSSLKKRLRKDDYDWIKAEVPHIRNVVRARHGRLRYPRAYSARVEDSLDFPARPDPPNR